MCVVDADPWDVFRVETRRAARMHECGECGRWIEQGEAHEYATGLLDGQWHAFRSCAQCVAAAGWLVEVCQGYLYHDVAEELADHWEEYGDLAAGRCVIGMRRRWVRRDGSPITPEAVARWVDASPMVKAARSTRVPA